MHALEYVFLLCCCLFCVNYCYVSMFAWVHWCHSVTVECRCIYFPECSLVGQCVCGKPGPAPSTTTNSSLEICSPSFRYSPAADSPLICYRQISVMFLLCSSNFIPCFLITLCFWSCVLHLYTSGMALSMAASLSDYGLWHNNASGLLMWPLNDYLWSRPFGLTGRVANLQGEC